MCVTCGDRYALYVVKTMFKHLPLSCANLYLYMHVFLIASYMLYADYIRPYLAMLVGLQNIGGVWILVVVHLYSNAKFKLCTLLGGALLYFGNFCCNTSIWYINCANPCVVIKHQKGGDWKGISRLNVFWCLVSTLVSLPCAKVIRRYISCMALDSWVPLKKMKRSMEKKVARSFFRFALSIGQPYY